MSKHRFLPVRIQTPMRGLRIYRHNGDEGILAVSVGADTSDVWIAQDTDGPLQKIETVQTDPGRETHPDFSVKAALEMQWGERLGCRVFVDWVK